MADTRYFELHPHIGLSADGNPEPLVSFSASVLVPTMVQNGKGRDIIEVPKAAHILPAPQLKGIGRIIPGTRIIETSDPMLAAAIVQTGQYQEIPKPSSRKVQQSQDQTTDASQEAGSHEE